MDGTLPIILRFRSNAKNDFSYASQPSRLVHLPSMIDPVPGFEDAKNDFAFCSKAGLSSLSNLMKVSYYDCTLDLRISYHLEDF